MHNSDYWIKKLNLIPHPEGGYYREIYSSKYFINSTAHSYQYTGERNLATSIYYLLRSEDVSRFHRLKSDEIWYYHLGSSLTIYTINQKGIWNEIKLGCDPEKGEVLQAVLTVGTIFGASVNDTNNFTIIGCMVSPGFNFRDFELIDRDFLLSKYLHNKDIILRLTTEE